MSENSYTPTEESTKISSNNEYNDDFEEEEEEYQYDNYLQNRLRYLGYQDPRDKIILENQRKIQRMQKEFKQEVTRMRANFAEICDQSSKIQFSMLERILQLKQKIKEINERNDFRRRAFPSNQTKTVKKRGSKKKSKAKKHINNQTQVPEVAIGESDESF